jgi:DNA-binding NarL/FixJ family response regulator
MFEQSFVSVHAGVRRNTGKNLSTMGEDSPGSGDESGQRALRLLVADDLSMIRQGIQTMLAPVDDLTIIGEATNGEEAVRLGRELQPDVVLIDQEMAEYDGFEALKELKAAMPHVEIIVMADRIDEAKALQAIECGAMGYILKDIPAVNLASALRSVCNDQGFFHPEIMRRLADRLKGLIRENQALQQLESEGLTKREFEVLIELTRGSTYNDMASKFVINLSTVKTHVQNIFRKLGCRNRSQVVAYVLRKGLVK